jgi:hypothetical protein
VSTERRRRKDLAVRVVLALGADIVVLEEDQLIRIESHLGMLETLAARSSLVDSHAHLSFYELVANLVSKQVDTFLAVTTPNLDLPSYLFYAHSFAKHVLRISQKSIKGFLQRDKRTVCSVMDDDVVNRIIESYLYLATVKNAIELTGIQLVVVKLVSIKLYVILEIMSRVSAVSPCVRRRLKNEFD